MDKKKSNLNWAFSMAWRDSRRYRKRLLLFTLSIVFGVAALVAINSFGDNLEEAIEKRSKTLLGADLLIASGSPFDERTEAFIAELGGEQARQTRFASMALFPKTGETRLVAIRGLKGGFPFYGELETEPAGVRVQGREEPVAIVDDSLMAQFGLEIGDPVQVGNVTFTIEARLIQIPGETAVEGIFSPRIYVPHSYVEKTELIQIGSIAYWNVFFQWDGGLPEGIEEKLKEAQREWMRDSRVWYDTVEERKREAGRILSNLTRFLNLVGFVALLLGGVGIAGSVQVYLKSKLDTIAVLRCLGASSQSAFTVFCIQVAAMGLVGTLLGAVLGLALQFLLPLVLAPFLPIDDLEIFISWPVVLFSMGFGWLFTVLFAFVPLLPLRKISPLRALRASYEPTGKRGRDPWLWVVYAGIGLAGLGFSLWQSQERPMIGVFFALGIGLALGILALLASLLRWGLRRTTRESGPYVWRQGLSNLYRPNNRTLFLLVTLGMGTFLIYTLYLTEVSLLAQGELSRGEENPNVLMFDIQPDQNDGVNAIIEEQGYTLMANEPVVTMRLLEMNGITVQALRDMDEAGEIDIERWALFNEYRSTYRDTLTPDEVLLEGTFIPEASLDDGEPVPISIEKEIVRALDVQVGDVLLFDVQGFPIETRVASIREVDWNELRPNFLVLFPTGILEAAPAFFITATRVPDQRAVAYLQRAVVQAFPNVSAVNLDIVLQTVGEIFNRVTFVIRFMASFTIATGLVVLVSAILTSRYQRVRESVLLRTLGAKGNQIRKIMSVEYILLGVLSAGSGLLLAVAASWSLAVWVFEIEFVFPWLTTAATMVGVSLLTLVTGLANSRGIASHPPLEVLREEV